MNNFRRVIYTLMDSVVDTYESIIPFSVEIDRPVATYSFSEIHEVDENGKRTFLLILDFWARAEHADILEEKADKVSDLLYRAVIRNNNGFIKLTKASPYRIYLDEEKLGLKRIEFQYNVLYMRSE